MRERVEHLLADRFGEPLPGQPSRLGGLTIGTFHSLCARVLRVETDAIGYQRNWVIYDTADQRALMRALMREMNLDEKRYSPRAVLSKISSSKNELVTPRSLPVRDLLRRDRRAHLQRATRKRCSSTTPWTSTICS